MATKTRPLPRSSTLRRLREMAAELESERRRRVQLECAFKAYLDGDEVPLMEWLEVYLGFETGEKPCESK